MRHPSNALKQIRFVDVFALGLGVLGAASAISLSLDAFKPKLIISVGVVLTLLIVVLYIFSRSNKNFESRREFNSINLILGSAIALIGLFFRWGPYRFEQGGQDQGLYVNMATMLSRWGSVRFPDEFRQSLESAALTLYDQTQLASYYLVDSSTSLTTIEFYPLHPALMSLSQTVFGGQGHTSLTIVSMLGLLGAWYLAIEIDGRRSVAVLFGLFCAVNPAFVFFSKFPVSESIALTFVIFGMLYFIRYLRADSETSKAFYYLISILSFNALFYVRWQFLLYFPFFCALLLSSWVVPSIRRYRKKMTVYVISIFTLFALSMVYYQQKQPELFKPVRDSLLDLLPVTTIWGLIGSILVSSLFLVLCVLVYRELKDRDLANISFQDFTQRLSPYVFLGAFLLSIPSIAALYSGQSMYPWGYRVPSDVDSLVVRYHALYRLVLFTSPVLFAVAIWGGLRRPARNNHTAALYVFAATCYVGILMRPFVPYLYYYGRYLIVDILPAVLLLGSIVLVTWMSEHRRALQISAIGFTILTLAYSLFFSSVMLGRHEGEDSGFYSAIADEITEEDVVLVYPVSQQVLVPLKAIYEMNVLSIPTSLEEKESKDFIQIFSEVAKERGGRLLYLVPQEYAPADLRYLDQFIFRDRFFTNTDHFRGDGLLYLESKRRLLLPTRWQWVSVTWQLFEIN